MPRKHSFDTSMSAPMPKMFWREGALLYAKVYLETVSPLITFSRYFSDAVLGCLHRTIAVLEWNKLKNGEHVSLERALGAYDMFVLHDREGDFDDVRVDAFVSNRVNFELATDITTSR
jgi:hypothetical protein